MILEILGEGSKTISGIESDHLTLGQLNMQDNVEIRVSQINRYRGGFDRRNLRPGMIDIGEFDKNHAQSHGREILQGGLFKASQNEVQRVVNLLHGNHDA